MEIGGEEHFVLGFNGWEYGFLVGFQRTFTRQGKADHVLFISTKKTKKAGDYISGR